MLVLSRKHGESIRIGHYITITVVEAGGGRVRLGIDAPRDVPVHREEIYWKLFPHGVDVKAEIPVG